MIIAALVLYFLSAIPKAVCDVIQFKYDQSIFTRWDQFCNPARSWMNKYKRPLRRPLWRPKYYKTYNLKYMERFPFSGTVFVFVADAWHFANYLRGALILASLTCAFHVEHDVPRFMWIAALPAWLLHSLIFERFNSRFFIKK